MRAAPIWSEAVDPHVICVRAKVCGADAPLCFDIRGFEHRAAIGRAAEHIAVRCSGTWLRLDVVDGSVLGGPAMLEAIVALDRLNPQIVAIRQLDALIRNLPPPRENDARLPRLVLALRALDGLAEGASLRELACGLFGEQDWPGDGEHVKSRVRRLVKLSQDLLRAGPVGVLAHRI